MPKEPKYLRILAFNDRGREILAQMKKTATLPIITKYGNIESSEVKQLFDLECKFTDIYNLGYTNIKPCGEEQRAKIEIIK